MIAAISSMATRDVLAELAADYRRRSGTAVTVESIGGVEAARRVRAGEAFDAVVLASEAVAALEAEGLVVAGSTIPVADSAVSVAVPRGSVAPDISAERALRDAVLAAPAIGYSTGPSGTYLLRLFERWGIAQEIQPRLIQAPPGTPVAALLASGRVALGFQQSSELVHAPGIDVVGPMPPEVQFVTTFSAALCAKSGRPDATRAWLAFLASPESESAKRRHGLSPVAPRG
jgi:molybdate transport system substrate-binding protein